MTTQQRIERIAEELKDWIQELVKAGSLSESLGENLIERNEAALTAFAEEQENEVKDLREELARVKCGIMSVNATLGQLL